MSKNTISPTPRKPRGRPFSKGADPRRHQLTQEERSRGFWTAISRYGVSMGEKLHASGRWPTYQGRRAA